MLLKFFLTLILHCAADTDTVTDRGTTTVNSTSVEYGSLGTSGIHKFITEGGIDPELPKTLAQVALSPLLVASRRFSYLPLESLFPQIKAKISVSNESNPHINLTSVLLNHSLHHGSDDELDRIVFSNLPQGSKLVLKTVKILKTDEDGNEEPMGEPAISFDVLPIGNQTESDEEEDDDDDEEAKGQKDLNSDASSVKAAGYDAIASNEKQKEKEENYHHGQDFGKGHTETVTDSDGKKVNKYKGREKGVSDFEASHGNMQSNDGERFKNSKKKNKGRKVTGFKRVYHKEEFQRTEHFYDDEEAKKIAESFGLRDSKEQKENAKKDDDRKYHGGRIENSEGHKVKNEHSTHHGHHKGQNVAHGNYDKHKHFQHQSTHHHTPNYQNGNYQIYRHPNHRYNVAAYSNPYPTFDPEHTPISSQRPFGPKLKLSSSTKLEKSRPPVPDETKIYRAETNRFIPSPQHGYYYAPNFGPPPSTTQHAQIGNYYNTNPNTRQLPVTTPRMKLNVDNRYAGKFSTPRPSEPFYSSFANSPPITPSPNIPYPSNRNPYPNNPNPYPNKSNPYPNIPNLYPHNPNPYPNNPNLYPHNPNPYPNNPTSYDFYEKPKNLISIDKAIVTKVPSPGTYFSIPDSRGIFYNTGFTPWTPIPSEKTQNSSISVPRIKNNSSATLIPNPNLTSDTAGIFSKDPFFPSRPFNNRDPKLIQRPQYDQSKAHGFDPRGKGSSPPPSLPNFPINPNFYYGPTLIRQQTTKSIQSTPEKHPASQQPNYGRKGPNLSVFMNNLMNSVSEFFSRMG